jgi:predicted Zn-dependent peptidase
MIDEIQETRLSNGLTILTDRMPGVRSATLGFFFRVGARHEPVEMHGISHFIEHTVFKGTSKRTALDIAIEQDRLGGNLDAFTTHEETGFAIKVIDDQLPRAFDLIADMLGSPLFNSADLESERRVIIEEMKMTEDAPEERLIEIFSEAIFPDHPLGLNIAGTPSTVESFDSEATRKYHLENYHPGNLVIAAAGNVDHSNFVDLVRSSSFGSSWSSNGTQARAIRTPVMAAPIVIKQDRGLEQAHFMIALPAIGATDPRRYAADLLASIVGGGTSSRLWQKVREERGLAYSVGASLSLYQDCGTFAIFAATSPKQVREVVDLSIAELRSAASDGVTAEELDIAKGQTRASLLLGLEDSAARAAAIAQSEMTHSRQISFNETLERLEAVTAEDVNEIARDLFRNERIAFAALGDLRGLRLDRQDLAV